MIRLTVLLLLIIATISISYSQCPDLDKLVYGGSYKARLIKYNPQTDKFLKFKEQEKSTLYHYPIKSIDSFAKHIIDKSNSYIIERAGKDFFKKVSPYDLTVIYHDCKSMKNFDSLKFELDKYEEITYCISYTFKADSLLEYRFNIEFDENEKIVSQNQIPDVSAKIDYETFITPCDAIKIARETPAFKTRPIFQIKLAYSGLNNDFEYIISEDFDSSQLKSGASYESLVLHINTQNGKIVDTEKKLWTIDETDF